MKQCPTSVNPAKFLPQDLRERLPPSSEGLWHGETLGQRTARLALLPLPLLLAALLTHKLLWRAGLSAFLCCTCCACCRLLSGGGSAAAGAAGGSPGASRGNSGMLVLLARVSPSAKEQGPSSGSGLTLAEGPTASGVGNGGLSGPAYPPALPALAILAGMLSVAAALFTSVRLIIPSQVRTCLHACPPCCSRVRQRSAVLGAARARVSMRSQ